MKRGALLFWFLFSLSLFPGIARSQEDPNFKIVQKGAKKILAEYTGNDKIVIIPEGVTAIGDDAFNGCESVTSVIIPESLTKIGDNAFSGCKSLLLIMIPENVTKFGDDVFEDCPDLWIFGAKGSETEEYAKKNGIPFEVYDEESFSAKNKDERFAAPKNEPETNQTDQAGFMIIQEGEKSILIKYTGHDKEVTIPEGVTKIEDFAFYSCDFLTFVVIPDGVTEIGESAFKDCSSLTSVVIPKGVTKIEDSTFSGCSSLTSVKIPASVKKIGESAFHECSSLKSVTIPAHVTKIGNYAFSGCTSLVSVKIPKSVTEIGRHAFYNCPKLKTRVPEKSNPRVRGNRVENRL